MPGKLSKTARDLLRSVKGKRARFVIDRILKNGSVTMAEITRECGQAHAARAPQDVKDQGIPLVSAMVRGPDGKRMAEYRFGDFENAVAARLGGRRKFPPSFKKAMHAEYGFQCGLCGLALESRALRIDHRIPYLVAGDGVALELDVKDYMLACGSCNSVKAKTCKHCPNGLETKNPKVCAVCYWASPLKYTHIATEDIRRLDLTWTGAEVPDYDAAKAKAGPGDQAMPKFVKDTFRRAVWDGSDQPPKNPE